MPDPTSPSPARFVSWNVNGLRAALKKGLPESVESLRPDFLCFQETKLGAEPADESWIPGYLESRIWHPAEKPGYAGTALLSRETPATVSFDLPGEDNPGEGRVITAGFDRFFLVNAYVPNSQDGLRRLDYRVGRWEPALREHLRRLRREKPVIYCGDLNVAHQEIDIARPAANRRSAGFTDEERECFGELLRDGFIDTFRHLHPDERDRYSWWSYRGGARERNVGWRLDYFVVSEEIGDRILSADLHDSIHGSDHCPVSLELGF